MSDVCDNCNGERELHVDCFDPALGHYTRPVPCPDCVILDDAALETHLEMCVELGLEGRLPRSRRNR